MNSKRKMLFQFSMLISAMTAAVVHAQPVEVDPTGEHESFPTLTEDQQKLAAKVVAGGEGLAGVNFLSKINADKRLTKGKVSDLLDTLRAEIPGEIASRPMHRALRAVSGDVLHELALREGDVLKNMLVQAGIEADVADSLVQMAKGAVDPGNSTHNAAISEAINSMRNRLLPAWDSNERT